MLHTLLAMALAAPPTAADDRTAAALLADALASEVPWTRLVELSDDIGPRLTGSPGLERAIAWGEAALIADGLTVSKEPVTAWKWVRGTERLTRVAPHEALPVLGLGNTVATPPGGITADVIVANDLDHLASLGDAVKDRIVLIDKPFTNYGDCVPIRLFGPSIAAKQGAVAVIIRSIGPIGHRTLHTGALLYDADAPRIPAAAIAAEDAARIRRDLDRERPVRLTLELAGAFEGQIETANVIGEVRGRELPEEIVLVSCHLDSWDVGRGAQDDASGCVTAMEATRLIAALPKPPRRTVRVVLFTNEENGLAGAYAYAEAHAGERHVAAFEDDTGAGAPLGFRIAAAKGAAYDARVDAATRALAPVAAWLGPIGATGLYEGFGGSDVNPLMAHGAMVFGLDHDMTGYWPVHHTDADTVDKIDPAQVARNAAALTVAAWWLAEAPPKVVQWPTEVTSGE